MSFFNLQLAVGLGYRKILLIGFDHYYVQPDAAEEGDLIDQTGDDENYFRSGYFKGMVWQAADVASVEKVYALARAAGDENSFEIANCADGGHLEVFRRGALSEEIRDSQVVGDAV